MDLLPLKAKTIRILHPVVEYEVAQRRLSPSGLLGFLRRWMSGKPQALTSIYVPYRLYRVTIGNQSDAHIRYLAIDAVSATLDPCEFEIPPSATEFSEIDTANALPALAREIDTRTVALGKATRLLFSEGFFRIAQRTIAVELIEQEFYVPHWVGFYGNEDRLSVKVLDALRGVVQGAKMSEMVKAWLLS